MRGGPLAEYTRRELGMLALACAGARSAQAAKPDSKWAGVQVGLNVPYSFGTRTAMSAEEVLAKCVQLGVSGVELRAQAIEKSMGLPDKLVLGPALTDYEAARTEVGNVPGVPKPGRAMGESNSGSAAVGNGPPGAPEQLAAYEAGAAELRKWRVAAPVSKAREVGKRYRDAGVALEIVKFDGLADLAGDELDYGFALARAVGARALSGELSMPSLKRLGQAAERNRMPIGLHGHVAVTAAIWEQAFTFGRYLYANVDIGHFVAGNNTSPLPFIQQHHDRITHIHVKDRMMHLGPNVFFGHGDTPIKQVLQAIRDHRWPIQATIEFEIPLAPDDDRMAEIRTSVEYCRQCLVG